MGKDQDSESETCLGVGKLSSEDLAALIVDALLRGDVVTTVDVNRAIMIVVEELEARKAIGDY